MTGNCLRTTIVNHIAKNLPVAPDEIWAIILEEYVQAKKFREAGYAIEPFDDLAALPGSYRMRLEKDGTLVDDRICRITELDEEQRRLSMFGDCLTNGMVVYVTYQAAAAPNGTKYLIDCHSSLLLDQAEGATEQDVKTAVADLQVQFDAALVGYLDSLSAKYAS